MKDICIRNKFNKKIDSEVEKEIDKLQHLKTFKFNGEDNNKILVKNGFYKLNFFLGFQEEDLEFLESIKIAISNLDSKKLIDLCDSYEFRFFKTFDYINKNIIVNCKNFSDIHSIFVDLFKNGKTINSINLSVFALSFFNEDEVLNFCKDNLCHSLDYLEVSSFVLRNCDVEDNYTYFDLFKYLYKDVNIFNVFNKLNQVYFCSYKKFILSFYLFDVKKIDFNQLNKLDFSIFFKYIFNCRKSLNNISSKFLFQNKFDELKFILEDLNFILDKIENIIGDELLNYNDFDVELCFFKLSLFDDLRKIYLEDEFLDVIFKKLIECFYDKNFKEGKKIIMIYNLLDIDISDKLSKIFNKEYSSIEFLRFILRLFREYKYFYCIVDELEENVYLTKLIDDFEFRNVLLRSLCVLYRNFYFEVVGIGFLNTIMNYQEFYNEGSNYINFVVQKISERS